jgi:hypothetical protein
VKQGSIHYIEVIEDKDRWRGTLKEVADFDFYHTYDYHQISKLKNEKAILLKYVEGEIIICLPLIIREIEGYSYKDVTSVYGYSGPLSRNIPVNFNNSNFINALNQFFIQESIITLFTRLNPFILNQNTLLKNLGDIATLGNVVNIDLTKNLDEQRVAYSKTTKRYINKSRKRLVIKFSNKTQDDIDAFTEIYYENMDRVNAKEHYYFSKEYFTQLLLSKEFKTDLLIAYDSETSEIVSAAIMIKTNTIVQYHLSGTRNKYLHLSPLRLLIDEMRIKATQEGYTFFNLGGGLNNTNDELFKFKCSFSKYLFPFKVWKHVINEEVYDEICKAKNIDLAKDNPIYFPAYRSNKSSV